MGKILVVEPEVSGHRLEYYHHIYMAAVKDKCNQYIFVFSADFRKQQSRFDWPRTGNIRIVILSEQQTMLLRGNIVKLTWKRSIFLIRLIRKYHPDKIFLLEAIFYLPYVPIFLALVHSSIEVNGIVFLVYTYRWKRQGYVRKILDVVKFWLMAKSACFKNIYIINDTSAVAYLNRLYKTNHFKYAPDPIMPIEISAPIDIRKEYHIDENQILLVQYGGLNGIKGTIEFLKSLLLLTPKQRSNFAVVLAGKVDSSCKIEIYGLVDQLKSTMNIVLKDEFCSYDFIGSLCRAANYVMLPYLKNEGSSGCLGIAAQFNVPVISTNKNLLGKLIRKNKLGIVLDDVSAKGLSQILMTLSKEYHIESSLYIENNSIKAFQSAIL